MPRYEPAAGPCPVALADHLRVEEQVPRRHRRRSRARCVSRASSAGRVRRGPPRVRAAPSPNQASGTITGTWATCGCRASGVRVAAERQAGLRADPLDDAGGDRGRGARPRRSPSRGWRPTATHARIALGRWQQRLRHDATPASRSVTLRIAATPPRRRPAGARDPATPSVVPNRRRVGRHDRAADRPSVCVTDRVAECRFRSHKSVAGAASGRRERSGGTGHRRSEATRRAFSVVETDAREVNTS